MKDQWKIYDIEYIREKFNHIKAMSAKYAFILINIKNFRYYNLKYGREKGDEILDLVFQNLKSCFADEEYVGHIHSDNFAVLAKYDDIDEFGHGRLCEILDKLYRLKEPCIYRNIFFSLGIYEIGSGDTDFNSTLSYADLCRRESKELHMRFTSIEIYEDKFYQNYLERIDIENKTAEAYKNYEFVTYLQPKVDLTDDKVIGAEALLRWFDKDGNSIPLYKFLPTLNENSYIVLVDLDIFDQMCAYLDKRIRENKNVVPISFNISNAYFYDPDILNDYITSFEKYNIPKEYIQMEFMESISLNDTEHMRKVISGFKEYGFTCVLDDFGNGYSSFNVLLNAPLDIIKMDRQFFLDNLNCDGKLVIKTVVDLIHSLEMKVVAEGVETEEHINFLKDCKCDYVQGYYYYKPMALEAFERLLDEQ